MAWTYDPSLSTEKDQVRFKSGDTNANDKLVQDETIQALLNSGLSVHSAAIATVRGILASLANTAVDRSAVGISASKSQRFSHFEAILRDLEGGGGGLPMPAFGGQSYSDRDTLEADTDFPGSPFGRGRDDNPDCS